MDKADITVLLIEDDADEAWLLNAALRDAGADDIEIVHVDRHADGIRLLREQSFDAVLLDLSLPDSDGIEGVEAVLRTAGTAPVLVLTGLQDDSVAKEAIRLGAQDYLVKSPRVYGAVPRVLRYTLERSRSAQAANLRTEQARRSAEMLLSKVISIVNAGLAITDPLGKFLVVNPALAELWGGTSAELLGRPWVDILAEEHREGEYQAYCKAMASDIPYERGRALLQCADGSTLSVTIRSAAVGQGNEADCRLLTFDQNKAAGPARLEDNLASLRDQVGGGPTEVCTGRIQTVGLRKVRKALGRHWQSVADSVYAICDRIIAAQLATRDTYMRNAEGDFIICFGDLNEVEAWSQARAISQAIHEKILGDHGGGTGSGPALDSALRAEIAELDADAHTIEVAPEELETPFQLAGKVTEKIESSVETLRTDANALLKKLRTTCKAQMREVHRGDRCTGTLLIHDLDPESRLLADRIKSSAVDKLSITADIDGIALEHAAKKIASMGISKFPLVAVDVHFSTLSDNTLLNRYLAICRNLDRQVTSCLVFSVRDIPPRTHATRIGWVTASLKRYSRLRMLQMCRPALDDLNLRDVSVALVRIDQADIKSAFYRDVALSKAFADQVHAQGARILVDHVDAADGRRLFQDLGVDFFAYDMAAALVA